jgi:hypothetical protein
LLNNRRAKKSAGGIKKADIIYMDTQFWGSDAWHLLHCITANYKNVDNNKKYIKMLFTTLKYVLPCYACRDSYKIYFEKYDIDDYLSSNAKINEWLYLIHNEVNNKLHKNFNKVDCKKVTNVYKKFIADSKDNYMPGWKFIYSVFYVYKVYEIDDNATRYYDMFYACLLYLIPFKIFTSNISQFHKYMSENVMTPDKYLYVINTIEKCVNKHSPNLNVICSNLHKHLSKKCDDLTCHT